MNILYNLHKRRMVIARNEMQYPNPTPLSISKKSGDINTLEANLRTAGATKSSPFRVGIDDPGLTSGPPSLICAEIWEDKGIVYLKDINGYYYDYPSWLRDQWCGPGKNTHDRVYVEIGTMWLALRSQI